MVIFPTIYKIYTSHNDYLINVVKKEFIYQAKNCYNTGDCQKEEISLKDLYSNNYFSDKLTNPINKKYYSENSYVNITTEEVKLIT